MKLLLRYLSRYKALIFLALILAAINQVFSLLNPYILGNYLIDPFANKAKYYRDNGLDNEFFQGVVLGLLMIIGLPGSHFQLNLLLCQKSSSKSGRERLILFKNLPRPS